MREIEFRGFDGKEWRYGDLTYYKKNDVALIRPDNDKRPNRRYFVDSNTVGEFTGLRDKNGKDIYEGDIVKHNFSNNVFGVVKWHPLGYFYINVHWDKCETEFGYLPLGEVMHRTVNGKKIEIEVIGNVYDNKDLLNENKHGKKY